jgi:hypothetical protein
VHMDDLRLLSTQQLSNMPVRVAGPNHLSWQSHFLQRGITERLTITSLIGQNLVAVAFQKLTFLGIHPIFSAGMLVVVVYENDLQVAVTCSS